MSVVSDYPDWSPHVAHANQIAATGVPLLAQPTLLVNAGSKTIAGGSNFTSSAVLVSQIGYEIQVSASVPATATNPFLLIELQWTDPTTGILCGRDDLVVPMGETGNAFLVIGNGPTKASRLTVVVFNLEGTQTATLNLFILQNSRFYASDAWHWDNPLLAGVTVPGFTLPTLPHDQSVLGVLNAITVSASGNKGFLFGIAPGQMISLTGIASGVTPASVQVVVTAVPSSAYTAGAQLLNTQLASGSFGYQFLAPRSPMFVEFLNNATSGTLTVSGMMISQTQ